MEKNHQLRNDIINNNILHEIFVSGPNCDFDEVSEA